MSVNILKLIPSSPTYVPSEDAIDKAYTMLIESLTSIQNIKVTVSENTRFIDPGVNWERVVCPNCRTVIKPSWWEQAMDKAYESGFSNLAIITPCCGVETSLNELQYEWPAGFARFSIEILNLEFGITQSKLQELEIILDCSLKKIWAHY